jgi:hypothetical protein
MRSPCAILTSVCLFLTCFCVTCRMAEDPRVRRSQAMKVCAGAVSPLSPVLHVTVVNVMLFPLPFVATISPSPLSTASNPSKNSIVSASSLHDICPPAAPVLTEVSKSRRAAGSSANVALKSSSPGQVSADTVSLSGSRGSRDGEASGD